MPIKTFEQLVAEAESEIETLTVEEAKSLFNNPAVQFIDVRDVRELWREGTIPGSYHAPRGMLESWVDPQSEYAKKVFQSDRKYVFFCAAGMRSALATKTVQDMGLNNACHIRGGFAAWKNAEGETEPVVQKKKG
ncbi:MAG: rhodanese-like domain-containing protein [Methyloligellaceae bacterium]